MSSVVGIDLSSKAIDLVKLDEESNQVEWVRCELDGRNAWERTLTIRNAFPPILLDDVYLVAIEAPYGTRQAGTQAILNRVVGAIVASLPHELRQPETCWIVRPDEYRTGLGLKHNQKPTWADIDRIAGPPDWSEVGLLDRAIKQSEDVCQNFRDAYCLAMWARDENAKGVQAA